MSSSGVSMTEKMIIENKALRDELEAIKASVDGYDSPEHAAQVADTLGHANTELQQRLIVAEQRAGEVEAVLGDLVKDCLASDFNEHWDAYKNAEDTLKPAEEG